MAKQKSILREYTEIVLFTVIIFLFIRAEVVQAFRIPSESMEPTLQVGDFLLVNKLIYGPGIPFTEIHLPAFRSPEAGDILVFPYPRNPAQMFIKRCVAIAGQKVEIRDKRVYVDDKLLETPSYVKFEDPEIRAGVRSRRDKWGPKIVPAGALFVMGDNRDYSSDSRYWGFVDTNTVVGNAFIIYWSWERHHDDPSLSWDTSSPLESITSLAYVLGYNIVHIPWRVRWNRLGKIVM